MPGPAWGLATRLCAQFAQPGSGPGSTPGLSAAGWTRSPPGSRHRSRLALLQQEGETRILGCAPSSLPPPSRPGFADSDGRSRHGPRPSSGYLASFPHEGKRRRREIRGGRSGVGGEGQWGAEGPPSRSCAPAGRSPESERLGDQERARPVCQCGCGSEWRCPRGPRPACRPAGPPGPAGVRL